MHNYLLCRNPCRGTFKLSLEVLLRRNWDISLSHLGQKSCRYPTLRHEKLSLPHFAHCHSMPCKHTGVYLAIDGEMLTD